MSKIDDFGKIVQGLHPTSSDHILGVAADIFDEAQNKYQSEINTNIAYVISYGSLEELLIGSGEDSNFLHNLDDAEGLKLVVIKFNIQGDSYCFVENVESGSWNGKNGYNIVIKYKNCCLKFFVYAVMGGWESYPVEYYPGIELFSHIYDVKYYVSDDLLDIESPQAGDTAIVYEDSVARILEYDTNNSWQEQTILDDNTVVVAQTDLDLYPVVCRVVCGKFQYVEAPFSQFGNFNYPTILMSSDEHKIYSFNGDADLKILAAGAGTLRPLDPIAGTVFFDTNLGKPIWYTGDKWVYPLMGVL